MTRPVAAAAAAAAAAALGLALVGGHLWPLGRCTGLVREQDIRGPEPFDGPEDDAAVLASYLSRRGPWDVARDAVSHRLSSWLRIGELQAQLRRRRRTPLGRVLGALAADGWADAEAEEAPGAAPPAARRPGASEEALLLVALALKVVGSLLLVLVPSMALTCWMLSLSTHVPSERAEHILLWPLGALTAALDRPAVRLLILVARTCGLRQSEVLCDEDGGPEIFRRSKRVLFAMMVVNLLASIVFALSLLFLVLKLRLAA